MTTSSSAAVANDSQTTTRHVIVTVIGATGHQGSGVVAALLRPDPRKTPHHTTTTTTTEFAVRAVTSNPSGSKAQALRSAHPSARLTLVQADLANVESLKDAIRGSYGVFFAGPFMPGEGAKAEESEEARWGRNVVDAVKVSLQAPFLSSILPSYSRPKRLDSVREKKTEEGKTDLRKSSSLTVRSQPRSSRPAESSTLSTRP